MEDIRDENEGMQNPDEAQRPGEQGPSEAQPEDAAREAAAGVEPAGPAAEEPGLEDGRDGESGDEGAEDAEGQGETDGAQDPSDPQPKNDGTDEDAGSDAAADEDGAADDAAADDAASDDTAADEGDADDAAGIEDASSEGAADEDGVETAGPDAAFVANRGAIEAMLFVSDEPVTASKLASMLDISLAETDSILTGLSAEYEEQERGIQLREVAGGWRLYTHPAHHETIEKYVLSWDTQKLSQAALEALAVVAYNQPTTRAVVSSIRGVNSDAVISSLVEKGLVREAGRENSIGQPILYATTRTFLEKFGLRSIKDLPPLEDFAANEETRKLIVERLSATNVSDVLESDAEVEDAEDDDMVFDIENGLVEE